jgi:protein FRG1
MSDVRSSKLKFKGEKTKKKRKRADADADADDAAPDGEPASARPRKRREDDAAPEAWVRPDAANEIRGPTFIIHPSEPAPVALTFVAARGKIVLAALDKDVKVEDGDAPTPAPPPGLLERVPTDVAQVWVTTRVAGNETVNLCVAAGGRCWALCADGPSRTGSGDGKFMSCDKHGVVTADVDARGPQEEWTPVVLPDGMVRRPLRASPTPSC